MGIAQTSESFVSPEDHSWLRSDLGLDKTRPGTLSVDAFLATWPTGEIPSGVVLGQITASKLLVPYDDDGTDDGRRVAVGHLAHSKSLGTAAGQLEPCAVLWMGEVIVDRLPANAGLDANGQ